MATTFTLPCWYDLHAHFRQGPAMEAYVKAHLDMGCAGILAMPNTKPPVSKVFETDLKPGWSIQGYLDQLNDAGAGVFENVIVPLYLTKDTTPAMIEAGVKAGLLRAAKYYPPHGTTNSEHGQPLQSFLDNGVLKALADHGVILCVHGEEHGLSGPDYFDKGGNAEDVFYRERLPKVVDRIPSLKIVCEHITTATAARFVAQCGDRVSATVTPQHLLYTVGHLVQGLKYHLYCLPLVKFDEDRQALRQAVTDLKNSRFFAGTDSAPHTNKLTECGCAAGCFTGLVAPQLYAQVFEESGVDLSDKKGQDIFKNFLGPRFYGLPVSEKTFTLTRTAQPVPVLETAEGPVISLPQGMGHKTLDWSISL
jgi:dihydroorotase